jgi:hypothetical protein
VSERRAGSAALLPVGATAPKPRFHLARVPERDILARPDHVGVP